MTKESTYRNMLISELKLIDKTSIIGLQDTVVESKSFTIVRYFNGVTGLDHLTPWAMAGYRQVGQTGRKEICISPKFESYVFRGDFSETKIFLDREKAEKVKEILWETWIDKHPAWKLEDIMTVKSISEIKDENIERMKLAKTLKTTYI